MGGVKNIWKEAKENEPTNKKEKFHDPCSHDGQLEILGFSSSIGMALERVVGGFATKIAQGDGPFHLTFKPYKS